MSMGPPLVYVISQQRLYSNWQRRLRAFPLLMLVGIGIAWSNTKAIWRGLTQWGGRFVRTPKFRLEEKDDHWSNSGYRLQAGGDVIIETGLALYALVTALVAYAMGVYGMIPFLALYAAAFGTVSVMGMVQSNKG